MKLIHRRKNITAICLLVAALLTGCATTRDTVEPQIDTGSNPSNGIAVRIDNIEDGRRFEIRPHNPSTPSLMNGEIYDKSLRSRAIGRKRGGYGKAMGDVLLPEDQTVSIIIKKAITRSFRKAGYRVVSKHNPEYAKAIPVTARIDKLWVWMNVGWACVIKSDYDITIKAPIAPMKNNMRLKGNVSSDSLHILPVKHIPTVFNKSLDEFSNQLIERLSRK